jgi:putative transposase
LEAGAFLCQFVSTFGGISLVNAKDLDARLARAQQVGLFRYALISQVLDPELTAKQRGLLVRELAAKEHRDADGQLVKISRNTLDRWVRLLRDGGFEALVPATRDVGPRTPQRILDVAVQLKKENPGRTAAQVARIMGELGLPTVPAERTLQRHFADLGLHTQAKIAAGPFGRFEAEAANDLWSGDVMHGPKIGNHKAYLFAIIDDHSRKIVGCKWTGKEDGIRSQDILRQAVVTHGIPGGMYVDNGATYVDKQFVRSLAQLGVRLIHSTPRRPQGRGKIERFFRSVRGSFVIELETNPPGSIDELNRLFAAWVDKVYHQRKHSQTGKTPQQRWQASWDNRHAQGLPGPKYASAIEIREAFLWADTRRVTKTATISLFNNTYEVDACLAGCEIEVLYDPFDLTEIQVRYQGRRMGLAIPHQIKANVHKKAKKDPAVTAPPAAAGIDFLKVIEAKQATSPAPMSFTNLFGEKEQIKDNK